MTTYRPLTDSEAHALAVDGEIDWLVETQLRRANRLAIASQKRLEEWTHETYVEVKEALSSYFGIAP